MILGSQCLLQLAESSLLLRLCLRASQRRVIPS